MEKKILLTKDGSHTISIPELNVTYHSIHGAIRESMHVFIEAGLRYYINLSSKKSISILEMGFGTGLNTLLTQIEAAKEQLSIHYTSLELYPISETEAGLLNYAEQLHQPGLQPVFDQLHSCPWNEEVVMNPSFTLQKRNSSPTELAVTTTFDIIFYDAFAPQAQPELWTQEVFERLHQSLLPGGILVTYCSKGDVRRAMMAAGFTIEKIPGPPGKREMVRGTKSQ